MRLGLIEPALLSQDQPQSIVSVGLNVPKGSVALCDGERRFICRSCRSVVALAPGDHAALDPGCDAAAGAVARSGTEPLSTLVRRSTLEDVFLAVARRGAREGTP